MSIAAKVVEYNVPLCALDSAAFKSAEVDLASSKSTLWVALVVEILVRASLPSPITPTAEEYNVLTVSIAAAFPTVSLPATGRVNSLLFLGSFSSDESPDVATMFSLFKASVPATTLPKVKTSVLESTATEFGLVSSTDPAVQLAFAPYSN